VSKGNSRLKELEWRDKGGQIYQSSAPGLAHNLLGEQKKGGVFNRAKGKNKDKIERKTGRDGLSHEEGRGETKEKRKKKGHVEEKTKKSKL